VAFDRLLRFDPRNAAALYYDGMVHARRKDFRKAVTRWRQVIEIAPASDFAERARADARTAAQLGQIFESVEEAVHAH
jgi:cytochrome c-type biogenesis protein CcmH/NrfG